MKKIVCLAVSLTAFAGFAQNNKSVEFTKKLSYKIEYDDTNEFAEDYSNINYDHYLDKSNKQSLLSFYYNDTAAASYGGSESNFFVANNWMAPLTVSGISKVVNYTPYGAFKILNEGQSVTKLDRKGTIAGTNCQYYAILRDINNKESYDYCFCIDESNNINNAESLFPNSKLKGLILSVEYNSENSYKLVYKSNQTASLKLDIDSDKLLADIEEYQKTVPVEMEPYTDYTVDSAVAAVDTAYDDYYGIYNDPLYTYGYDSELIDYNLYNYITPVYSLATSALYNTKEYGGGEGTLNRDQVVAFFKKEAKSLVKNLKSAKMITADQKKELDKFFKTQNEKIKNYVPNQPVDYTETTVGDWTATDFDAAWAVADTVAYEEVYDYYTKYQSNYNNINVDEISLAYDILHDDSLKQYAPDYCDNLKSKIPNFQNESLSKHVYNLTGQICDLYLYNNGGYVDYFGTINSMRKSYLEIEKLRNSLSQKDQKLLLEFIKILD